MFLGGVGEFAGGDVPCPTARMAEPLRFGQIGLAPPEGLFGTLAIADVLDVGDEPRRPSSLICKRRARHGGVDVRPVFPHDPKFEAGASLAAIELCHEGRPAPLDALRQRNSTPDDLIGAPADKALECRVVALHGLVPAE